MRVCVGVFTDRQQHTPQGMSAVKRAGSHVHENPCTQSTASKLDASAGQGHTKGRQLTPPIVAGRGKALAVCSSRAATWQLHCSPVNQLNRLEMCCGSCMPSSRHAQIGTGFWGSAAGTHRALGTAAQSKGCTITSPEKRISICPQPFVTPLFDNGKQGSNSSQQP